MKLIKMPDLTRTDVKRHKTSWVSVRRTLKGSFAAASITTCELKYEGCWRNNNLSFAHALKRRHLVEGAEKGKPESVYTVILACVPCHQKIEVMGESTMKSIVMHVILNRKEYK